MNDSDNLVKFWSDALKLTDEQKQEILEYDKSLWKDLAPSEKLCIAAESLSSCTKVLDYGCGTAWAGIIASKSGCKDVVAVDVAEGALDTAIVYADHFDASENMHIMHVDFNWLKEEASDKYDGFICSNVLDVVPMDVAEAIISESARITTPDAKVIISLNYYLDPSVAKQRGMELVDGKKLYVNGILRLVSLADEEWAKMFSPYYEVEKLVYFAWPGEAKETRRLFYLKKK